MIFGTLLTERAACKRIAPLFFKEDKMPKPRLFHIYMHSGVPVLLFGFEREIIRMILKVYGEKGLKMVRALS